MKTSLGMRCKAAACGLHADAGRSIGSLYVWMRGKRNAMRPRLAMIRHAVVRYRQMPLSSCCFSLKARGSDRSALQ